MTRTVVFAGPSLHGMRAAWPSQTERHAPAGCGDILRAVRDGATCIGLIDGVFESQASVWHKEILLAITEGVRVLGAASMGALRAAECHAFGMEGIGGIFEEYLAQKRISDADVAVLHAPAEFDYQPMTVALVDAEATIDAVERAGAINSDEAFTLRRRITNLYYKERSWHQVCLALRDSRRAPVSAAIAQLAVSRKRQDAAALLAQLGRPTGQPEPHIADGAFSHTLFMAELEGRLDR
jgi:hypothetical protein